LIQRIITAAVLIPLVLLLILRAPIWLLAIVAGIVALLAIREFLELVRRYGVEPFTTGTYVFVGIFFGLLAFGRFELPLFLCSATFFAAISPFVFLTAGMKRENLGAVFMPATASVFAVTYIAIPMGMLVQIRQQPPGAFLLIYLMIVVWSGDIVAYFVGKSIGRHKMSPRVSPKKTWEGAAASLLASIFFGTLLYQNSMSISLWPPDYHLLSWYTGRWVIQAPALWLIVLLSAALNVAAQLGDLVESVLKRGADVKDSGSILPGHGGMLDRIDAMLFATPVLWGYALLHLLH
jgi:phosphatidate cytidylyltransferase